MHDNRAVHRFPWLPDAAGGVNSNRGVIVKHRPDFSRREFLGTALAGGLIARGRAAAPPPRRAGARKRCFHNARSGYVEELPDLGTDSVGLRESQPERRVEKILGRGRPPRRARRRWFVYFVVGQVFEQTGYHLAEEPLRPGRTSGGQPHLRPCQRESETARRHPSFGLSRARTWLIEGKKPHEVIRENVRLTSVAATEDPAGNRPGQLPHAGGFSEGLSDRPDVQLMLRKMGFSWVSSKYPAHPLGEARRGTQRWGPRGNRQGASSGSAVHVSEGADRIAA